MSVSTGPYIVTNGLIFNYDMNNTGRSWVGRPTTNTATNVNLGFGGERWTNVSSQDYPNKNNLPFGLKGPVWRLSNGNNYWGYASDFSITAGNTYTLSGWYYVATTQNMIWYNDVWNSSYTSVVASVASDTFVTTNNTNGWRFGSKTMTLTSGGAPYYVRGTITDGSGDTTPTGNVYMANFQIEQQSFATPFVNGTRSNTQSLLDLTQRSVATSNNLVYNSDNTFQFIYSNPSTVQVPLSTAFNKLTGSINVWIYPTSYNGGNGIFVNNTDTSVNYANWLWIGPYSGTFYFRLGDGSTCCNNDLTISNYPNVVPVNTWTNLCCTWSSGGTSCIYINGSLYTSRAISSIPSTSPAASGLFGCGHSNADSYYNGKMPVGQIYNRQLTADEVMQNFNAYRKIYGI